MILLILWLSCNAETNIFDISIIIIFSLCFASLLLKPEEVALRLPALSAGVPFLVENCLPEERAPCPPLKYRSPSSYCNNVQNPQWGGPYTGFGRLLNAHYNDGENRFTLPYLYILLYYFFYFRPLIFIPSSFFF